MTDEQLAKRFMQVSSAARDLRIPAPNLYPLLQKGDLDGIVIDGRWLVSRQSVEREIARRKRIADAQASSEANARDRQPAA